MFFIYSESDDFDIGSPSATAFPAYLEEEDCGGEIIERGSVEFEGGKSEVPVSRRTGVTISRATSGDRKNDPNMSGQR